MKYAVNNCVVLSKAPEGPIAEYVEAFADSLSEQGYVPYSIHRMVLLAACFSGWLERQRVVLSGITSEHPPRYLQYRTQQVRSHRGDAAALGHLLNFLRRKGAIPAEKISKYSLTPAECYAQAYELHLREARGLAKATIVNYVPFIRRFLKDRFGDGPVIPSRLRPSDIVGFVRRQAPRMHPKSAKSLTSALRSFLQYLRYRGAVKLDLAAVVPIVANWSMSAIPRGITPDQVRELLGSVDQSSAVGHRDYAILLLLARLGLRSGEVLSLELDDIDWDVGCLNVRGKSGQRSHLPLSAEVGKALAAYLKHGRPSCSSRRVFLHVMAPIDGFKGPSGIASMIRHRLERAGIKAPTYGAHQFRHGLATDLLRQGASLGEIGELLGHRSPETTKIYTKVDIEALRTLALPWPGGAR